VSGDFLADMAAASRARADHARTALPERELWSLVRDRDPPPPLRLSASGFDLIAEVKLRSPAQGVLRRAADDDLEQRVRDYAQAGAAAVSVLTEPSRFDGSLQHLERAAAALAPLAVPAMRKDFLVDPYQVLEARAAGAGGVLLILRMLDADDLAALLDAALQLQLFVLLEAFDEQDIDTVRHLLDTRRAAPSAGILLGVNCRDLATLQVVPDRLEELAPRLPAALPRVAESGLAVPADAARLAAAGYDLALVGNALMTGGRPRDMVAAMLRAGRGARSVSPVMAD
jgi:indole-3-glycerol phosphate synthase